MVPTCACMRVRRCVVRGRPGRNIFLAETSATCGGLDSLLEPHGTIKAAQELAAQTFGSDRSFWVTNGTSTANKIVVQGLVRPGDIVLVDRSAIKSLFIYICYLFVTDAGSRNCHKSHHLGLALVGASVVYLEAYPLRQVLAQRMRAATDVAHVAYLLGFFFSFIVRHVRRCAAAHHQGDAPQAQGGRHARQGQDGLVRTSSPHSLTPARPVVSLC